MTEPVRISAIPNRREYNCANCNKVLIHGIDPRYGLQHILPRLPGKVTVFSGLLQVFWKFSDNVIQLENDTTFIICRPCATRLSTAFKSIVNYENSLNKSGRFYTSIFLGKHSPVERNEQIGERLPSTIDNNFILDTDTDTVSPQSVLKFESNASRTETETSVIPDPNVNNLSKSIGAAPTEEKANSCCSHCGLSLKALYIGRTRSFFKLGQKLPENTNLCSSVLGQFFPSLSTKVTELLTKNELVFCEVCARYLSFAQRFSEVFINAMNRNLESGTFSTIFKTSVSPEKSQNEVTDPISLSATPQLPNENSIVAVSPNNIKGENANLPSTSQPADTTQGPCSSQSTPKLTNKGFIHVCDHCGFLGYTKRFRPIHYNLRDKLPDKHKLKDISTALEELFPNNSSEIDMASKANQLKICTDCVTKLSGAYNSLQRFTAAMNTTLKNGTYATIFGCTVSQTENTTSNIAGSNSQIPNGEIFRRPDVSLSNCVENSDKVATSATLKHVENQECLVCLKRLSQAEEIKKNGEDESAGKCQTLKMELQTIFLFRKLLELPQDLCCTFLAEHGNPSLWFNFCGSCWQAIVDAKELFDIFVPLQKLYENMQAKIKDGIIKSVKAKSISAHRTSLKVLKRYLVHEGESHNLNGNKNLLHDETEKCGKVKSEMSDNNFEDNACIISPENTEVPYQQDGFDDDFEENINTGTQEELGKCVAADEPLKGRVREESMSPTKIDPKNECDICGKFFRTPAGLKGHKQKLHINRKNRDCSICGKTFRNPFLLKIHTENTHSDERKYKCSACVKSFKTKIALKLHEKLVHILKERNYLCNACGKSFKTISGLRIHEKSHLEKKPFQCRICDKSFILLNTLKCHEAVHTGERNHFCSICGRGFIRKNILVAHMQVHDEGKKFSCQLCGKSFQTYRVLECHLSRTHSTKRFPCKFCGKVFKVRKYVNEHETFVHAEDSYKCHLCDETFRLQRNLLSHLTRHQKESGDLSVYKCQTCEETFDCLTDLTGHRKISPCMEKGRWPKKFLCNICGQTFLYEGSMLRHNKLHEEQQQKTEGKSKTLECLICGETFEYFWGLWLHKEKLHPTKKILSPNKETTENPELP